MGKDDVKRDILLSNRCVIYNTDCRFIWSEIPDKSVDMILCDLPYGTTKNKWDVVIPFEDMWREYKRIAKDNAAIVLFAQGIFYCNLVSSNPTMFRYDLVWDKQLKSGFLNANRMPLRQHEQIAVFYKRLPTYNPQFTEGEPLHSKGTSYKTKVLTNNNYGYFHATDDNRAESKQKYPSSIVSFQKPHPSVALHPTQKPVDLLEWLIKTYTNENDVVFDNCMGVGSTGVACANTNRKFIGIEIESDYYDISKERILNAYKDKR